MSVTVVDDDIVQARPVRERYEDRERCHAQKDGDCDDARCPQLRDGEPAKTGRHCPIDTWIDDDE